MSLTKALADCGSGDVKRREGSQWTLMAGVVLTNLDDSRHNAEAMGSSILRGQRSARDAALRLVAVLAEQKTICTVTTRFMLMMAAIAVAAGASACDFRNPDGQQDVRGPGVFPTPAVLTSTY
jgi:hypothetical protein